MFIKSFVRDVKATSKEVELAYTIPMQPRGVMEDKMPVLSIVQNVGAVWTVPELLFEKKYLIPALQQLLISFSTF
jgi:hypothetical protein